MPRRNRIYDHTFKREAVLMYGTSVINGAVSGPRLTRGNCYDNAHMESFFHTLKTECLYHKLLDRLEQVQMLLFQYINAFHNTRRPHSSLDYLSPEKLVHLRELVS